jgi:glucokinase
MIVLAGDIGGTNSRLALYRVDKGELTPSPGHEAAAGGGPIFEHTYPSAQHPSLEAVVLQFLSEAAAALGPQARPERACLAVAGPVENETAHITNLAWFVDARRLAADASISTVQLVNDFEAAAAGVPLVGPQHLIPIGGEAPRRQGPMVVAGPGTGLGQAFLFWSAAAGRYEVAPSEGGHADFAASTPLEHALAAALGARYGHVSWERVVSGPGLRDIFAFLQDEPACGRLATDETRAAMVSEDGAAVIVRQAVAGRDPLCRLAVDLFLSALGALAGNLALTVLATGGVFISGGIAPRLQSLLAGSRLRETFEAKGRLQPVLKKIPLFIVTHREIGLLGAAAIASR